MIDFSEEQQSPLIRRYIVVGSRRLSNYWWASILILGSFGFLLTGISSYLNYDLVPFINSKNIIFFPQGLVMCFYGFLGLVFSSYLWLTLFWSVGGGFNEFNKKDGMVRIFRWGFPGKNRRIDLFYEMTNIEAIRVELKEGINPRRIIYIRVKGNAKNSDNSTSSVRRDIPLTRIGQPLTLEEVEEEAAELAKFLQIPLEMV
jgi:hypothetical protein